MEDWFASLKVSSNNQAIISDIRKLLSGQHSWHATSHARPTYCNVCREPLSGVTSHGLSCEICKCKVHKRCAVKAISNCKWTTLASVGKDIIEDKHGTIWMPHQWMEGNLTVSAKCVVCEKTCGSVLRLQDWRCLWCKATVHTACRPKHSIRCPLGPNHVSVVPPTAIHSIGNDDAWEAVRPHGCSPLLVFVNSKSGDNQGVKFLRRFRQILNPAQVFDLITSGPTLGLRLFRNFDPFRVLVCSGDGSVGWVLSEIDRLNMQKYITAISFSKKVKVRTTVLDKLGPWKATYFQNVMYGHIYKVQCEVGVLPLGTGNDLARVLGWGASCDDDTHLPQLVEKYERASHKILDRWSVMVFEKSIKVGDVGNLTLNTSLIEGSSLVTTAAAYEDSVLSHLTKIIQSDQHSTVISSAKVLCETVKDFISKISDVSLMQGDGDFSCKCQQLKTKLEHLLQVLHEEQQQVDVLEQQETRPPLPRLNEEKFTVEEEEKQTQDWKRIKKERLLLRVNSLKKAVRQVVEHTEKAVDDQNLHNFPGTLFPSSPSSRSGASTTTTIKEIWPTDSKMSPRIPNVKSISPLPDIRRDSSFSEFNPESLPVPQQFADSRHGSFTETTDEKSMFVFEFAVPMKTADETEEQATAEIEDPEEFELEDDALFCERSGYEEDSKDGNYIGSLNEQLANIGHIDSSETSDDSPEGSTEQKKEQEPPPTRTRSSLRDSIKESEHSYPLSIDGVCNLGSELDMTNLFSTSPEEEEECSEEYRREMGLEGKRCSIAHFVEGSDIARKSIKCRHRKKSMDDLDAECVAVETSEPEQKCASAGTILAIPRIEVSADDSQDQLTVRIDGSASNVSRQYLSQQDVRSPADRRSYAASETDDEECVRFGALRRADASNSTGPTVIVDPPSPPTSGHFSVIDAVRRRLSDCRRLSAASPLMSVHCSPSPTRRISNISLNPADSVDPLKYVQENKTAQKVLPIINPLVRLPQWPNVTEPGIVGKVLLANADALCAAAVPLMDPDEAIMEGFFERCVMNNYFGIGIDAKISLDFHHKREEHPEKCRSRTRNYMWYGVLGSKQWLQKTCKNLEQKVQLECDGQRIPLPSLQGIVVLNIPSFMGGINFWGGTKEDDIFLAPSIDDRILEVVAVFGTVQMAASRLINLQHHRIAQCSTVQISILGEEGVPIQVDGEAWVQPPGMIRIIHKNRMKMLCRNKDLENSLKAWEEKQRQIRHQHRLISNAGRLSSLSEDEINILLEFIEATTSLIKYVKLLIIRNSTIEVDLYQLAATVGINLERVHPSGKLLQGLELRPVVTELVLSAQRLVQETSSLLQNKSHQIAPEIESQLTSSLAQMEIELEKCTFAGSTQHPLVYFNLPTSADDQERRVPTGRKSSGAFWQRFRRGSSTTVKYSRKEIQSWDVPEVNSWLESLQLGEYCESFATNDIRGRELLTLTRTDLRELGVTKVGHVKRLLLAIKEFTP